jgi:hypothetical protein
MGKRYVHPLTTGITHRLKTSIFVALLLTLTISPKSRADTVIPPLKIQVKQVARWFTGFFNNAEEVANNPSVPPIDMSNCAVHLDDNDPNEKTQNVYVEQTSTTFNRIRLYSFNQGDATVTLKIRSFINPQVLSGICDRPWRERVVDDSNVIPTSCDLELKWEPRRYVGSNAPNGCITSSNSRVVSRVTISRRSIDSLDQIFDASGNLIVNTPIKFHRIDFVPEFTFPQRFPN